MALKIKDLPLDRALDRQAMAALRGGIGEGHWVFGWMVPFAPRSAGVLPVMNTVVQNNFIGQVVNQTQNVSIINTGDNANITALIIGSQGNSGA
jgi:hypothetical protein